MSKYAQSIDFILAQVRTLAGPVVGGQAFFYAAGTTTPKTIWLDRGKTTPAANPYTLGANATAQLFGDGLYRVVLTYPPVVIPGEDPIPGATIPGGDIDDIAFKDASGLAYDVADYASLAAACATLDGTGATLQYSTDQTLVANLTTDVELMPLNGAVVNHGAYTISYSGGTARWPLSQIFNGTGTVTFGTNTPWDYPEWRGAIAYADLAMTAAGIDSTSALQASFNSPTPTKLSGYYQFSNLTLPTLKTVAGDGIHVTGLVAKTGSTGIALTEQGSAAKITLKDFAIYGREQAYTGGLKLGYTTGGIGVFGTEGLIDNVWVRDFPEGFPGIDIVGNVGQYGRIMAQTTGGVQIIGTGNMVGHVESMQSKGFNVVRQDASNVAVACNFGDTAITAMEIEATDAGIVPLYLTGNTDIGSLWIAPTAGATYPHLIELGAAATTWAISNFKLYFNSGTAPTITNGNFKSGTVYFGGNATGKSYNGEGNYSSSMWIFGNTLAVANQKLQSFALTITNTAGTLQHRISDAYAATASALADKVNGATLTLTNTPTGTDSSTAMVAGGKIGSASTNSFWLDVADQVAANGLAMTTIQYNSSGTALTVVPAVQSLNINGVTQSRLNFQFYNAATGANFALTTANIAAGKAVQVLFMGFIK